MFTALHCHSVYSFHAGVCTPLELVQRAKQLGMEAIALTDRNRMSGLILFYQQCIKAGIKPILGVELTEPNEPENVAYNIVLLAKNAEGYSDICEIITLRNIDPHFSFTACFSRPWDNIFFITTCPAYLQLLATTPNRANLYGELINNDAASRQVSREVAVVACRLGVPLVATTNAYFLDKADWNVHQVLTAIGANATRSRLRPEEYASPNAFLRPIPDMHRLFPNHADAIANSVKIANRCKADLLFDTWIMPEITTPDGETPAAYLKRLANNGLQRNYGKKASYHKARQIQEMELAVIEKLGYQSYFLIVKDIRDWANRTLQTPYRKPRDCTILRGSAANSITFYNLGVSDLDPIQYDLYFQRFLNEDRASPPDADLDFGWDEREKAIDYIVGRWGRERVAITCTINHFRRRSAFRETAKVFGYSDEQITKILKSHKTKANHIVDAEIGDIMSYANRITGMPRFTGQHPGGLLITNKPICRHVALEYSGGEKNRMVTQIDMHSGIDELGLIKFDILGNGSLSVVRDTVQQLFDQGLPDPDVANLDKCYNDPAVQMLIQSGRTKGVFYIESPAQTRLNQKCQAQTFEEITVTSSLVRPAGTSYTQTYVERHRKCKQGIKDWEFLHPALEPILRETHDVCAFQEDITKICHQVAGLSYKKTDTIRKLMNSLHSGMLTREEYLQVARDFLDGCSATSGLTPNQAHALWERVSSFTGFSFCKSHSASYAQLSFKCTYLKAHYPAQFLSAVVSNNHGFYSRDVYLNEARRFGIRILPMHINESGRAYYGKHTWIRPGMMHVRQLKGASCDAIVQERRAHGSFKNLTDFIGRVRMSQKEVEQLILVGAFDSFGLTQPESLFLLDDLYRTGRSVACSLFEYDAVVNRARLHPGLSDYTYTERCLNELRLLGFMLSGNILAILDLHPAAKHAVPANELARYNHKRVKVFGWVITSRLHRIYKKGTTMLFLTIEDNTECIDIIFWPDVYEKYHDLLLSSGPFAIYGTVSEASGTYCVEADEVQLVQWSPGIVDFERASERLKASYTVGYSYADVA